MTNPLLPPLPDTLSHSYVAYLLQQQGFSVSQIQAYLHKPTSEEFSLRQIQRYLAEGKANYKIPKRPVKLTKQQLATIPTKDVDIDVTINDQFKELIGYIQYAGKHGVKASLNELTGLFDKTKKLENEEKDFEEEDRLLDVFEKLVRELAPLMNTPIESDNQIPGLTTKEAQLEEQIRMARSQARRKALIDQSLVIDPGDNEPDEVVEDIDETLDLDLDDDEITATMIDHLLKENVDA